MARPRVKCTESFVKSAHVVCEIRERTVTVSQTYRYADRNISHPSQGRRGVK